MDWNSEEEINLGSKTWAKVSESIKKVEFVEGKIAGQNSVFQDYFDKGYEQGLGDNLLLGQQRGFLEILKKHCTSDGSANSNEKTDLKTVCCICNDNSLLSESLSHICQLQKTNNANLSRHLEKDIVRLKSEMNNR